MDQRDDLDDAVRTITAWIRDTDSFTQVVARWLRSPVEYELKDQEIRPATPEHAEALDLSVGSRISYRRGVLQTTLGGASTVLADVRAAVVEHRLSWSARQALQSRDTPLGAVLSRYEVRRHTHAVKRTSTVDDVGEQVLRVSATLTMAGRLVAKVDEAIYRPLLECRTQ